MSKKPEEPRRDYTESEKNEGFIGRRMSAFANRSRDPGDGATWAVVLGSFMWTVLIICLSVAELLLIALVAFGLALVWVIIMAQFGKVNVASILWGSATTDADKPPVESVVFQSTLVVALISLLAVIVDAIRGWDFRWYGIVLIVTIAIYLAVYIQSWIQPART